MTGKAVGRQPAERGGFRLLSMCKCAAEKEVLKLLVCDLLSAPKGWVPGSVAALSSIQAVGSVQEDGVTFAHRFVTC